MKKFFAKYKTFLSVFIIICLGILFLFYNALKPKPVLPIYQPAMVNYELVDSNLQHVKKFHKIDRFRLQNQNGVWITEKNFQNKIYIADFFFTTCPSICPIMTDNMLIIQKKFEKDSLIMLLSHTVTPKIDSVEQLKKYALEKGVLDQKWHLVTGDKKQIYDLARQSYLAVKTKGDGSSHDMIHTENFILVDPNRRIRGFYDGTDKESIYKLMEDIIILKNEFLN